MLRTVRTVAPSGLSDSSGVTPSRRCRSASVARTVRWSRQRTVSIAAPARGGRPQRAARARGHQAGGGAPLGRAARGGGGGGGRPPPPPPPPPPCHFFSSRGDDRYGLVGEGAGVELDDLVVMQPHAQS